MAVVYRHRKAGTQEVFYIGIGKSMRRPYRKDSRSNMWTNYVNKYGYEVDILFNDISYERAKEIEILLIKIYGRRDIGTGCLVNHTNGGDGNIGFKHTEEAKIKISEMQKGKKLSEETKKKMSETKRNDEKLKEQIRNLAKSKIGTKYSKERCDNISKGRLKANLKMSEEHKNKLMNVNKKLILNLETGIYYLGTREAAATINMNHKYLAKRLNGIQQNNTSFIYV